MDRSSIPAGVSLIVVGETGWKSSPTSRPHPRRRGAGFGLSALPEVSNKAAFVVTLNPGVYTVHTRDACDTEGVALVEVYTMP